VGDVVVQLQRLQELVVRATAATTIDGIARVLFDEGMSTVGAMFAGIWLLAGDVLEPVQVRESTGILGRVSIALDAEAPLAACVRERAAIWIADSADYERRFPASFERYRVPVGCVCLPLVVGERAIGGAVFAFTGTRTFSDPERGALELLARQCAQAIDRMQLVEAEHTARLAAERAADRMIRLQAAVSRLSAGRGEDEIAGIVIDESFAMIGATTAALWLRSGSEVNLAAQVGASRVAVEAAARISIEDRGPLGSAMRARQAVWLPSRAAAAAAGYAIHDARWHDRAAMVVLPLVVRDELIGGLGMSFAESREVEASERHALELFASHAAQALSREQENETERLLGEASKAIASSLDRQTVLQRLADLSVARFADWCIIDVERDGMFERSVVAHSRPQDAALAEILVRLKPSPRQSISQAIDAQEPVLVPRVTDEMAERITSSREHATALRECGVRSVVCAPMVIAGRAIGGITWATCKRTFDERDMALAMRLAGLAAAGYENARLYSAEAAIARRLAKHHELVAALSSARTPVDVCQVAAQKGAEALGAKAAMVYLRSTDGRLKLAGAAAPPEDAAQWAVIPADPAIPANRAIATGEPIIDETVCASMVLPLVISGTRSGVFSVIFGGEHQFTKEERAFVSAMARSCEQALERAQLYVNEATARREAEAVGRAKDTFVAMAGHALRNRVSPILSALEVMRLAGVGEGTEELEVVERQAEQLIPLIDELLAIARGTALDDGMPLPKKKLAKGSGLETARTNTRSLRVLVVEDNIDMAMMLGNLLRTLGHEPMIAHDGPAALAHAERERPHLAFLDLGLPGMDGFELARKLREQPAFGDVPVVALTGYDQASDRARTREAGFVEHLVKPIDLDQLYAIVDRYS
jgi:GAF domain-containing protein